MTATLSKLGKYQILGVLGKGSMGVVYKGIDPRIGKLVAIKTMNQKHLSDPNMQERFYREGNILGQLTHRNIISVYNVGEDQDTCYIAMEYLDGTTLERIIRGKKMKLSLQKRLDIVKQVCEGIHAAHQQGIIHRDLKPANIFLLNDDHVKVLDFGVAHFKNSQLTTSGVVIGTINYIAPEQITGLKIDHRADIFSLGVILYEMLSGNHPFVGKNLSQTMVRIINEETPRIPDIPESLNQVVRRSLEKDRDRRYESAMDLAADLDNVIRTEALVDTLHDETIVDADLQKAQVSYVRKLVEERIQSIEEALRSEEVDHAEGLIQQLTSYVDNTAVIEPLMDRLAEVKKQRSLRMSFVSQLTHDTLLKANREMEQKHYVVAIEYCQKVLKMDPGNQDARIIKANCIKKLQKFLDRVGKSSLT
ncbi:MAG: serine/threonine protein kinase [Acidobacteria bacterium]|nr:serine/threonine protein kinase [Acidobacteriota bacterium]